MSDSRPVRHFAWFSGLILVCVSILSYLALIQPWALRQEQVSIVENEVAAQDFRAPYDFQYISEVRTEQARREAERAVQPVYAPPDPRLGREQFDRLDSVLGEVAVIRADQHLSIEEKKAAVEAIAALELRPESIDLLLRLSNTRWEKVRAAALSVLEQAMRTPIRNQDLPVARAGLPLLVSPSAGLTQVETDLVVELVSPFVVPNSFYSPELTEAARQAAREAVEPVIQSYKQGQTIVSSGEIITPAHYEALTECGLVTPTNFANRYVGAAAIVFASALFTVLYFVRRRTPPLQDLRGMLVFSAILLVFLVGARIVLPNRSILPYLYPLPAFGLLVSVLFGMESGMVFSLLMSILVAYGMPDGQWLLPYYLLTSLCGVLALGRARRLGQFLYAAGAIAASGIMLIVAYRFPFTEIDWIGLLTLLGAAVFYGVASPSLTLPFQYILSQFLGLTTALQLLEISRPDSPLLKYFLQRAPGTYQHSLQVANLAEQAAERIGADGLLTRVAALFHDVGKAANPLFFVENQPPDQIDSHDDMPPLEAAAHIIRHVEDGLKLARKYRLPRRLLDFISEHHGTLVARYQYNRAVEAAGGDASQVDLERFRYPGPKPRSRETAILMLADGVEARARAQRPQNDEQMYEMVRGVIAHVQKDGQLDHAPLTQKDLQEIAESFVSTLRVTYHPRLEYPKDLSEVSPPPPPSRPRSRK
ncbi:MAG: HDIG domain-containing metalloprotein [Anaerolineales bacterium]